MTDAMNNRFLSAVIARWASAATHDRCELHCPL